MTRPKLVFGLAALAAAGLAGCGRSASGDADLNEHSAATTNGDDRFGKTFERASSADPNSKPINVADGDLEPVSETAEPVDVH